MQRVMCPKAALKSGKKTLGSKGSVLVSIAAVGRPIEMRVIDAGNACGTGERMVEVQMEIWVGHARVSLCQIMPASEYDQYPLLKPEKLVA
jgi:hypothetical protein